MSSYLQHSLSIFYRLYIPVFIPATPYLLLSSSPLSLSSFTCLPPSSSHNVILAFLSITSKSFSFPFSRHFSILLSLSLSLVHSFCLLGSSKRLLPIFLFLSSRRLLWPFFLSHFLISLPFSLSSFFQFIHLFLYLSISRLSFIYLKPVYSSDSFPFCSSHFRLLFSLSLALFV